MNGGTKIKACLIMLIFLLGMACTAADGQTIYVDDNGPADFNNIQAAINDANDGDTIIVADGTYTGDGNRDIEFLGKAIVLRSENGPHNCIIDCNGTEEEPHRGFNFLNGEDSNSVLDGFTIRNGYDQVAGGGILCSLASSPTISNCIITNNRAKDDGGGIMCSVVSPIISNCIITRNIAEVWWGGGIMCRSCKGATLDNCIITENSAACGGGIGSSGDNFTRFGDIIVTNCTFSANIAQYGGAVYVCDGSKPSMVNCILWGDTAIIGQEIALTSMWPVAFLYVSFSNVQGGEADVYEYGYLYWEAGNIDSDPCFADPCNGDYHLKSQAGRWEPSSQSWIQDEVTSPCIDAGNPGCPLGNEPNEPNNVRRNMGAYGGTEEASKSPANWRSIADLTNDWVVDSNDLKVFVSYWLETGECIPGDLNRNQFVNFSDFALLALNWPDDYRIPDFYYYSSGRKIPLILHKDKLVVRFKQGVTLEQQLDIVLSEEDLMRYLDRETLSIFDLIMLFFREGVTERGVMKTINSLNIWSEVEFANPFFHTPDAPYAELTLTDEFLVKFDPSVSQAEIEAFNTLHNVEIVTGPSSSGRYKLRVKNAKNINTLKTANRYYEAPITIYSVPNFVMRMPYP